MASHETERNIQEIWALFRETGKRFEETGKRLAETERLLKESGQETDRRFKETDRQFKETDQRFKKTEKLIGKLGNKWGDFVEGFVVPAIEKGLFRERGIIVEEIARRVKVHRKGREIEIDILAVDTDHVLLVEVKSSLSQDDVRNFLKKLEDFKFFFPRYSECRIFGAVAAVVIPHNVGRSAYQKGLFVVGQTGDNIEILNDQKFQPKNW